MLDDGFRFYGKPDGQTKLQVDPQLDHSDDELERWWHEARCKLHFVKDGKVPDHVVEVGHKEWERVEVVGQDR